MANGFFMKGMKHIAFGEIVWKAAGGSNIRTALIDTLDYTVNLTTNEFLNPALGNPVASTAGFEEESANMTLIDAADDGILDANDVTFTATTGDTCEGILVFQQTAADTTDVLLFWWDSASGLPVTLGGDVTVQWDNGANKVAKI